MLGRINSLVTLRLGGAARIAWRVIPILGCVHLAQAAPKPRLSGRAQAQRYTGAARRRAAAPWRADARDIGFRDVGLLNLNLLRPPRFPVARRSVSGV